MRSWQRRGADTKSARCAFKGTGKEKQNTAKQQRLVSASEETKGISGGVSRGYGGPAGNFDADIDRLRADRGGHIALDPCTAVGTRFVGMESPNDDNMWLVDRLTGSVYKCQASERGKASCTEIATGSIGEGVKH